MLTPDQKGNVAETAVVHEATRLGLGVLRPVGEGLRYDLVFDLHPRFVRVQCKWAPQQGSVVVVRCQSARRAREGLRWRGYTADEIDAIAAYCPEMERCYLLPIPLVASRRQLQLRLDPAKNNQRLGILWAQLFEFSSIDWANFNGLGP